jgi:hypothetical protein
MHCPKGRIDSAIRKADFRQRLAAAMRLKMPAEANGQYYLLPEVTKSG